MVKPVERPAPVTRPAPVARPEPASRSESGSQGDAKRAANIVKQKLLSEAGFATAVDGVWGPDSEKMWAEYQLAQRDKAQRDNDRLQAEAKAQAEAAAAEGAKQAAETERIKALAAADKAKADAEAAAAAVGAKEQQDARDAQAARDKSDREARERTVKTGLQVAAVGAGLTGGTILAKGVSAKDTAALKEMNKQLRGAAKTIDANIDAVQGKRGGKINERALAKVRGSVTAADKVLPSKGKIAQFGRLSGRLGLIKAGIFLLARLCTSAKKWHLRSKTRPRARRCSSPPPRR